jgi:hypothetical protein
LEHVQLARVNFSARFPGTLSGFVVLPKIIYRSENLDELGIELEETSVRTKLMQSTPKSLTNDEAA